MSTFTPLSSRIRPISLSLWGKRSCHTWKDVLAVPSGKEVQEGADLACSPKTGSHAARESYLVLKPSERSPFRSDPSYGSSSSSVPRASLKSVSSRNKDAFFEHHGCFPGKIPICAQDCFTEYPLFHLLAFWHWVVPHICAEPPTAGAPCGNSLLNKSLAWDLSCVWKK